MNHILNVALPALLLAGASLLAPHPAAAPPIVINEILAHTDPPDVDSVELFNQGDVPVDLSGWLMTDSLARPQPEWVRIADGTLLNPGEFYVIADCAPGTNQAPSVGCSIWQFGLSEAGDDVFLLQPVTGGSTFTEVDRAAFGVSPNGVSFGRYVDSAGNVRYPLLDTVTLGAPNSAPLISPVVIEEIMYHPPDGYSEYVVIANTSAQPVALQDGAQTSNRWKVVGQAGDGSDSDMFTFETGTILAPGERVIVAGVTPALFRQERQVPASVRVFGPMSGKFDNDGEQVALAVPQPPELNGTVLFAHADAVAYLPVAPWPPADGTGLALARVDATAFGNDVANWQAGIPLARVNSTLYLPAVSNGATQR